MWPIPETTAHLYADLATVATALIAVLAAVFTLGIYYGQRIADRRSFAKGLVREVSLLAFENPKFANPGLAKVDFAAKTFDGSHELFTKYERYLDFTLWTDEEILEMIRDPRWHRYVRSTLENHRDYLNSGVFGDFEQYFNKPLSNMIRDVLRDVVVKDSPADAAASAAE